MVVGQLRLDVSLCRILASTIEHPHSTAAGVEINSSKIKGMSFNNDL